MKAAQSANLIIRPEKIGDIVISTPVIRAFKETYPDQPLHLLTDPLSAEIVRHDPHLDKIIAVEWENRNYGQHTPWREIYNLLKSQPYERAAILYANCPGWNWLCAALRIRHVAQIGGTMASFIFHHHKIMRRSLVNPWHMAHAYLKVAESLGAKTTGHFPKIFLLEDEVLSFSKMFPVYAQAPIKILLHLGASPEGSNYSVAAFQDLALHLANQASCSIFVTGRASDAAAWNNPDPRLIRNELLGQLSLRQMACAVRLSDLLIGNSTGVIHIAAALNRPVLALFSSDPNNDETKWGPLSTSSRVLKPSISINDSEKHHDLSQYITKQAISTVLLDLFPTFDTDERCKPWAD